MTLVNNIKGELKSYLELLLKNEDIENLEYNIDGNSGKGDGYIGDVVFATVSGTTKTNELKHYNLVLKCSKTSQVLREKSPVKQAFLNEIYLYDVVFPSFAKFQKDRNIDQPFGKVPKCYGTISTGNMEIIALENLKSKGYILWERTTPLTRKQINLVVEEYARFHSVSIAMKHQEPDKFQQLAEKLDNIIIRFMETTTMLDGLERNIEEISELLSNDFDKKSLEKWLALKPKVKPFFKSISKPVEDLNVITHGDCWSNNFLHYQANNKSSTIAIIDWQLSTLSSPVLDLSYFLFTCLSEEDMDDLDNILKHYHTSLTNQLEKFEHGLSKLCTLDQFLSDWKKYCIFGIVVSTIIHKFSLSENDEVPDMAEAAEKGEDIGEVFLQPIKDTIGYRNRMHYIVKYVVENPII